MYGIEGRSRSVFSGPSTTTLSVAPLRTYFLHLRRHLEHFSDFLQHPLALFGIIPFDGSNDAGVQMIFQDLGADLVECRVDGLDLADDVNAICVVFHHADHTAQVTLNRFQTAQSVFVVHGSSIFQHLLIDKS